MRRTQVRLRSVVAVLWSSRWWLFAFVCVAGLLSVVYAITRAPLYESRALLAPTGDDPTQMAALSGLRGQLSGLTSLLGLGFGQSMDVEETVAVLRSRDFTERFIEKHEILPELFPELWDEAAQDWKQGGGAASDLLQPLRNAIARISGDTAALVEPGEGAGSAGPDRDEVIERFDELRTISIDRRTSFVELKVRARTPALARQWGRQMIDDLNEELRQRALTEARENVRLITENIELAQIESLRVTAANLLEGQLKRVMIARTRKEYALRSLEPPTLPERRHYPRRTRMVILGVLAGLVLGSGFVIARNAYRGVRQSA